jgi:hypothetical protein
MPSPDNIEIKEVGPTLRGYGREEVLAFLRSVAENVRRLEEQLEAARSTPCPVLTPNQSGQSSQSGQSGQSNSARFEHPATPIPQDQPAISETFGSGRDSSALVFELKDAISELSDAITRLRNQGALNTSEPTVQSNVVSGQVADVAAPTGSNGQHPVQQPSDQQARVQQALAEQRFAGRLVVEQRLPDRPIVERRGPTRLWQSSRGASQAQGGSSMDLSSVPPSLAPHAVTQTSSPTREHRNRNLIAAYLDSALGRRTDGGVDRDKRSYATVVTLPDRSEQSRIIATTIDPFALDPASNHENVVVLKRSAS